MKLCIVMFVTDVVLRVCTILFKSEQICGCCCKMLRGSLFWDTRGISIVVILYVDTSLVLANNDEYVLYYAYTSVQVSFTHDRLGRCFRFVYIFACIAVFLLLPFLGE